jgi:hypothetical protein
MAGCSSPGYAGEAAARSVLALMAAADPADTAAAREGLRELLNLLTDADPSAGTSVAGWMVDAGAAEGCSDAMRRHPRDREVQRLGATFIATLAGDLMDPTDEAAAVWEGAELRGQREEASTAEENGGGNDLEGGGGGGGDGCGGGRGSMQDPGFVIRAAECMRILANTAAVQPKTKVKERENVNVGTGDGGGSGGGGGGGGGGEGGGEGGVATGMASPFELPPRLPHELDQLDACTRSLAFFRALEPATGRQGLCYSQCATCPHWFN